MQLLALLLLLIALLLLLRAFLLLLLALLCWCCCALCFAARDFCPLLDLLLFARFFVFVLEARTCSARGVFPATGCSFIGAFPGRAFTILLSIKRVLQFNKILGSVGECYNLIKFPTNKGSVEQGQLTKFSFN